MNIESLNKKIFIGKKLGEGEYANYMMQNIEEKEMGYFNFGNFNEKEKQIKF